MENGLNGGGIASPLSLGSISILFTVFASMSPQPQDLSFSMEDFEKALTQHDYGFAVGQTVKGIIADHVNDGAFVDIGGKAAAFLPQQEASLRPVLDLSAKLPVGESFEFVVIRDQNEEGQVTLSLRRRLLDQAWEKVQERAEGNGSLDVKVTGSNRGGVTVDVEGLKGFIPRSHLREKEDLDGLKGKILNVKFLEVNAQAKKLVLSERLASQSARMAELEVGQLISGQVASIKPFGAFISFGGTTGLLHIKQVSDRYVESLSAILEPGQTIQAMVVDIDEGRGRIALSTKILENHAGEMLENMAEVMASAESRAERARKKLDAQ